MNPIIGSQQPSLKLWGEEETDGAIYTIYLKKVRYHHSPAIESEIKVSRLEWETIRIKIIKAGTLEKLVESLTTDSGELESTYMNIFLSTYRSFATPTEVLNILLNRYEQVHNDRLQLSSENKEEHKRTLEKVLLVWIDIYSEDFDDPPDYSNLNKIIRFAEAYIPGSILLLRASRKLQKLKNGDYAAIDFLTVNNAKSYCSKYTYGNSLRMLDISDTDFALQLTYTDNELFKKLVPYQCLGSVWSRRDKICKWNVSCLSVSATVNQFNAVSLRVISSVLSDSLLKQSLRARIVAKWINIAQELRLLKNFSSLKAITAALQSNAIHRLKNVWLLVPREKVEVFSELAEIFSEENNQTNCRELLIKEGTAKFVDTLLSSSKMFFKSCDKNSNEQTRTMQGTVPYLGTFLTDLTMIDAAIPDYLPSGLINFDKKRKEFEILAQIKLLQSAANSYDIAYDADFHAWFYSLPMFDEKESYARSCLIEPPDTTCPPKKHVFESVKNSVFKWTHQKSESTPSTSSSSVFCDKNRNEISVKKLSHENGYKHISKSCSSLPVSSHRPDTLNKSMTGPVGDFYIIKVSLEKKNCDTEGRNLYKSIMLYNNDRTRTVILNAMAKHGLDGNPENYTLVQIVPGGEIVFPDSANVFYAINPIHELKFVLRLKSKTSNKEKKKK